MNDDGRGDRAGGPTASVEHWWPRLSIGAKHRVLADMSAPIDAETAHEIEELCGEPAPVRLTPADEAFVHTQIEPVD
ncbi:hypothetical protein [Agromyces laixinhei]|uniref:hypothetical protein n=1 Tax=Agromyces laixinhei TaxID=2585717 RepID=UPI0012ED99F8|nr:hypothetical protein [Agromyces laixinhei]